MTGSLYNMTFHFQELALNLTPEGQLRWPIFVLLLCMIVLTERTSKFSQPIIFWILVFSFHKMALITKITGMPLRALTVAVCLDHLNHLDHLDHLAATIECFNRQVSWKAWLVGKKWERLCLFLFCLCLSSASRVKGVREQLSPMMTMSSYMSHCQMLGKVESGLPAKIWRLVGCTDSPNYS